MNSTVKRHENRAEAETLKDQVGPLAPGDGGRTLRERGLARGVNPVGDVSHGWVPQS